MDRNIYIYFFSDKKYGPSQIDSVRGRLEEPISRLMNKLTCAMKEAIDNGKSSFLAVP